MKQYLSPFEFEGKSYEADVTEIGGLDDVQYAVSPRDPRLAERFKEVVLQKVAGEKDYLFTIPQSSGGSDFMDSLVHGLDNFLKKNS